MPHEIKDEDLNDSDTIRRLPLPLKDMPDRFVVMKGEDTEPWPHIRAGMFGPDTFDEVYKHLVYDEAHGHIFRYHDEYWHVWRNPDGDGDYPTNVMRKRTLVFTEYVEEWYEG